MESSILEQQKATSLRSIDEMRRVGVLFRRQTIFRVVDERFNCSGAAVLGEAVEFVVRAQAVVQFCRCAQTEKQSDD